MRTYKLVLLLKSDLKKEAKEKLLKEIRAWFGKVASEKTEDLGEKRLAYPINKNQKGDYVLINFETDKIDDDLSKKLEIREEVLRKLLIRVK